MNFLNMQKIRETGQLLSYYKNITATTKSITIIAHHNYHHFTFKLFNFDFLVSNTGVGLDVILILTFYVFPGKFFSSSCEGFIV